MKISFNRNRDHNALNNEYGEWRWEWNGTQQTDLPTHAM